MQDDALWQAVLGEIELSISHGNYVTWFKNTALLKNKDNTVVIGVPNVFIQQHMERKYTTLVSEVLANKGLKGAKVEFKSSPAVGKKKAAREETILKNPVPANAQAPVVSANSQDESKTQERQGLNERYTFENFIVGSGNELAYAACQAVVEHPGTKYNPLFLYGGVGIGKTHLMQAVGNAMIQRRQRTRVVYVTSEQFTREFIEAVRFKKNTQFASYYRNADVLIIDDVQFIAGKDKTQEEFFHTFNTLHQANKQIILSSDRPPKEILTVEERLRSRLGGGMAIDMQIPDFETRCAIIQTKAQSHGVELEPEVVDFLANHVPNNIRELEGALNQLLAFCEVRGLEPDIQVTTGLLGTGKARPKHLSPKQIIERTAKHFQVPVEEIMGPKRDKDIVVPRQVAMYMLREELKLSFPKIAKELGRKDHTTAIHSVEKINRELNFDDSVRSAIAEIKERLYV